MGHTHEYATAVMRRGRVAMEPADFVPDWVDRPRKEKYYPGAERFPLPDGDFPDDAGVGRGLAGPQGDAPFSLPLLGGMLRDSYGLVGRRLAVQANTDLGTLPMYTQANWSRGTASGGGLYPVGVHWVSGASGPMAPGVYHYAPSHHAVRRLLTGDVSGEVRAAVGDARLHRDTDQFLVLGVKFWQNAFKYNSFSYHVVTMDTGALLQTWRMWAQARGLRIDPVLWFDEPRLSRLLGAEADEEGVFAVVPLRWDGTAGPAADGTATSGVRRTERERSRRVLAFETVRQVHRATLDGASARPAPEALEGAAAPAVAPGGRRQPLPPAAPMELSVRRALRERRSSFGRFTGIRPLSGGHLAAALKAAEAGASLATDVTPAGSPRLASLYVFVNHVEGVAQGVYAYDARAAELRLLKQGPPGAFLQAHYFLNNYNLEQAAAVIVPAVRTHAVLDAAGDRGYRLVSAAIGAAAQAVYTATAASGTACGVALGFDSVAFAEELGLTGTGELPLLLMLVGNERPRPADFRYELVPSADGRDARGDGAARAVREGGVR
ncbi:SagB family peptide dehydrogenase [Actinacidiphila glaucinigra]|uniref:SagB-type dehydrogenase domain-containing protein n=1 Tax=Actinacidiphila glaucinigra TaxID=235986 RepID=A0A239MUM0_9ACTN|nr:SagB family peptide dehydrogenase [Actinacidiphila glaucinigra]SNT46446.1 SagB-type dehydrogenase domain-containing protein [Actinacidiphila glaucinigra]